MNCRPGDLAIVVSAEAGFEWSIGKFVTTSYLIGEIASRTTGRKVQDAWRVEPIDGPGGLYDQVRDKHLRAIRDPGDDAKDEMLHPLPKEVEA